MKLGKKDKTREIPRNSRQNFRNSREFPPGILGSAIPGNSRTGIPCGLDWHEIEIRSKTLLIPQNLRTRTELLAF